MPASASAEHTRAMAWSGLEGLFYRAGGAQRLVIGLWVLQFRVPEATRRLRSVLLAWAADFRCVCWGRWADCMRSVLGSPMSAVACGATVLPALGGAGLGGRRVRTASQS